MNEAGDAPSIDFDKAVLSPEQVFDTPEAVVAHDGLTKAQKAEVLRRWEYDASEASVATEEGMPGGEDDLLRRILLALDALGVELDADDVSPTKQHGIPRSAIKPK